jgi:eukaryotic-like serine/threonine-protein kinase
MDLTPRAVIAGRYRVDAKVGAGGMGEVWVGENLSLGVRVAVKTLLPAAAMNHEVVARFKREAYLLGRIRSDHVARVVDFVPDDVYGLVLVMEFVEGDPLSRVLQERTLSVEEGVDLALGLAHALKDLHSANIIHRDLKPGNIIMAPLPDGRRRAVVVDFGVSRLMSDKNAEEDEELTGITRADMAVGTIEYMAPEQILNSRNVTPGSDIYAAGAMLFRAVAGRHIFGNVGSDGELAQKKLTTESQPLPLTATDKLTEGLARVVAKMIKRRPKERYLNADEVLADLLPLRDSMHASAIDTESPTIDMSKGLPPAAMAALAQLKMPAQPAAPAAVAPAPAPVAPAVAAQPAPAPVSSDSRVSVAAVQQPPAPIEAPRRGVSPVLTFALVAAALAGGVFLGPRVLQPGGGFTRAPETVATAVMAAAPAAPTATAAPTAEPAATASAAAVDSAAVVPATSASAAADGDAGALSGDAGAAIGDGGAALGDAGVAAVKPRPPAPKTLWPPSPGQ